MKDAFLHELLAQLDTPQRHFEYKPSSILAISASNERPTSEELRAAHHAIESRLPTATSMPTLPAELLLEIFRLTFSSHRGYGFNLASYQCEPWVLSHAQNKLDNLHRVEVLITNEKERTAVADLFANAPKLQHVTILSGFPFIEALGSAVMLERLEVRCCILDEAADSQTEIACNALLPRLRHMATSHPKALGFLHLPVVEKLICDESFTTQLNFPEKTPKYLLLVLPTLLTLERLNIEVTQQLTETYLDPFLLRLRSQPHLLPRLRSFTFEEFYDADMICQCNNLETSTLLMDVLHGRQGVLETVYLELNHPIAFTAEDRLRLQALKDDGLDFETSKSRTPKNEDESEGEEEFLANVTGSDDFSDDSE
ncbi:hypothetical protein CPB85DRAFT_1257007 [Mucidula mucida]|nr:hypothetical protein CPB85DRAFT_1257007 [Mucidula mucida]